MVRTLIDSSPNNTPGTPQETKCCASCRHAPHSTRVATSCATSAPLRARGRDKSRPPTSPFGAQAAAVLLHSCNVGNMKAERVYHNPTATSIRSCGTHGNGITAGQTHNTRILLARTYSQSSNHRLWRFSELHPRRYASAAGTGADRP